MNKIEHSISKQCISGYVEDLGICKIFGSFGIFGPIAKVGLVAKVAKAGPATQQREAWLMGPGRAHKVCASILVIHIFLNTA